MIKVGLNIGSRVIVTGGGGGFDADAQAFFDRVATAGGTLTTTEKNAVNQLVLDMKSAGIWTAMKAVYPMVGASAAACAQNLKSSSFTGTFTSGWTFASTGVTGNGTSAYLDSNFLPSVQSTNNNTHISFYSRSNIQEARAEMGVWKSGDVRWSMELNYYLNNVSYGFASDQYNYTTGRVSNANTNSQGFYIGSRTNSTTHKAFKNNAQLGTTNTGNSGNVSNIDVNMYIGAVNASSISYSSKECAFASIGDGLTDTQASNFYTAVQAFNTTLNRYVDAPWYNNGNLLLDTYPSAAAAYSVRKLRNNYIGGPIRVRRSSDNAEQDIYFDANGNLDTAQLTSFCGAGNGFVTTWYDQSGNARNATQTTAANQPQIVSSGSVLTENSKPSILFNNYYMIISSVLLNNTNVSAYFAALAKTSYTYGGILTNKKASQDDANAINILNSGKFESVYNGFTNSFARQTNIATTLFQGSSLWNSTNVTFRTNGTQDATALKVGTQAFSTQTWMGTYRQDTNNLGNFTIPELIVYQSDQSANNSGIENNIKTYYGI